MNRYSWNILHKGKIDSADGLLDILLENRGIRDKGKFINPPKPDEVIKEDVHFRKLVKEHVLPSIKIIQKAISENRLIIIHGDYDVDGISAAAILWRATHNGVGYKHVRPYIPNRFGEGYGLSTKSLNGIIETVGGVRGDPDFNRDRPLLITVDCGITSLKEIETAKNQGFEVIVTDHHQPGKKLPKADQIIWTDKATGAGIAWIVARELVVAGKEVCSPNRPRAFGRRASSGGSPSLRNDLSNTPPSLQHLLPLAALGTICDLQPLTGFNRSIVKHGLTEMNKNPSVGIKALAKVSSIKNKIGTYEVGWFLGPRLNATGRLQDATDSLRLLCTDSLAQAKKLARDLDILNRERQEKTQASLEIATRRVAKIEATRFPSILLTFDTDYHEGVIGLIAGKLAQMYNHPSIAISIDEKSGISKGSARSVKGVSIINTLRKFEHLFESLGGHDVAAGFSIKTEKIIELQSSIATLNNERDQSIFQQTLDIDAELPPDLITLETFNIIQQLKPFGIDNKEPTFITKNLRIFNLNPFGKENKHLKIYLEDQNGSKHAALAFGQNPPQNAPKIGDTINIAYQLSLNTWGGRKNLELKTKDIKLGNN